VGILNPDTSAAIDMAAIEPGTYPARITEAPTGVSKSGNPKVTVKMDVQVDGKTRKRQADLVATGPGAFNFDRLLRACGFSELADQFKDPNVSPKPEFDTDQLIGCELQVVIAEDIYNGEKRDKIASFLPL
jgi:hypothetical protein